MTGPIFIAVEGLDGVGKSTIAELLAQSLQAELLSTPPKKLAAIREMIDTHLADNYPARFWHYGSTVLKASSTAKNLLIANSSVVVDRYLASTIAYAHLNGYMPDRTCIERECLTPDFSLFLTASTEARKHRMLERGLKNGIDRTSLEREEHLYDLFQHELQNSFHGQVITIDTSEITPQGTVAMILSWIQEVGVC